MTDREPGGGPDIEALVRRALDREAERVDPRPLFDRIKSEVAGRPRRSPWRWSVLAAAAALLVAALGLLRGHREVLAGGETVVREARRAHLMPVDRCYLVEVRRESPLASEVAPIFPQVRQTRLWTRGDRFWVESARPDQRWAWGRDEADRLWIAFDPHSAVRFDADEVPDRIAVYCDLHSLNLERHLDQMLDRFDLVREDPPGDDSASTIRIHARARDSVASGPGVRSADLEVDAETRVIRRMVVRRSWNGHPLATVTYTLAETDALDPLDYQVEGHLVEPSEVFTRDHQPQRRRELLARWFGNRPGRLLKGLAAPGRP